MKLWNIKTTRNSNRWENCVLHANFRVE